MLLNDKCWILLLSGICLTRAFDVFVVPDQEDIDESTEYPTEEVPTSTEDLSDFKDITMEPGEYTTYMFQYENEQNMGMENNKPDEKCFDEYATCLMSIISGAAPVCAYQDQNYYAYFSHLRTFRTTCDMSLDNCFRQHRHWRVVDVGRCELIHYKAICDNYVKNCPWYYHAFKVVNT